MEYECAYCKRKTKTVIKLTNIGDLRQVFKRLEGHESVCVICVKKAKIVADRIPKRVLYAKKNKSEESRNSNSSNQEESVCKSKCIDVNNKIINGSTNMENINCNEQNIILNSSVNSKEVIKNNVVKEKLYEIASPKYTIDRNFENENLQIQQVDSVQKAVIKPNSISNNNIVKNSLCQTIIKKCIENDKSFKDTLTENIIGDQNNWVSKKTQVQNNCIYDVEKKEQLLSNITVRKTSEIKVNDMSEEETQMYTENPNQISISKNKLQINTEEINQKDQPRQLNNFNNTDKIKDCFENGGLFPKKGSIEQLVNTKKEKFCSSEEMKSDNNFEHKNYLSNSKNKNNKNSLKDYFFQSNKNNTSQKRKNHEEKETEFLTGNDSGVVKNPKPSIKEKNEEPVEKIFKDKIRHKGIQNKNKSFKTNFSTKVKNNLSKEQIKKFAEQERQVIRKVNAFKNSTSKSYEEKNKSYGGDPRNEDAKKYKVITQNTFNENKETKSHYSENENIHSLQNKNSNSNIVGLESKLYEEEDTKITCYNDIAKATKASLDNENKCDLTEQKKEAIQTSIHIDIPRILNTKNDNDQNVESNMKKHKLINNENNINENNNRLRKKMEIVFNEVENKNSRQVVTDIAEQNTESKNQFNSLCPESDSFKEEYDDDNMKYKKGLSENKISDVGNKLKKSCNQDAKTSMDQKNKEKDTQIICYKNIVISTENILDNENLLNITKEIQTNIHADISKTTNNNTNLNKMSKQENSISQEYKAANNYCLNEKNDIAVIDIKATYGTEQKNNLVNHFDSPNQRSTKSDSLAEKQDLAEKQEISVLKAQTVVEELKEKIEDIANEDYNWVTCRNRSAKNKKLTIDCETNITLEDSCNRTNKNNSGCIDGKVENSDTSFRYYILKDTSSNSVANESIEPVSAILQDKILQTNPEIQSLLDKSCNSSNNNKNTIVGEIEKPSVNFEIIHVTISEEITLQNNNKTKTKKADDQCDFIQDGMKKVQYTKEGTEGLETKLLNEKSSIWKETKNMPHLKINENKLEGIIQSELATDNSAIESKKQNFDDKPETSELSRKPNATRKRKIEDSPKILKTENKKQKPTTKTIRKVKCHKKIVEDSMEEIPNSQLSEGEDNILTLTMTNEERFKIMESQEEQIMMKCEEIIESLPKENFAIPNENEIQEKKQTPVNSIQNNTIARAFNETLNVDDLPIINDNLNKIVPPDKMTLDLEASPIISDIIKKVINNTLKNQMQNIFYKFDLLHKENLKDKPFITKRAPLPEINIRKINWSVECDVGLEYGKRHKCFKSLNSFAHPICNETGCTKSNLILRFATILNTGHMQVELTGLEGHRVLFGLSKDAWGDVCYLLYTLGNYYYHIGRIDREYDLLQIRLLDLLIKTTPNFRNLVIMYQKTKDQKNLKVKCIDALESVEMTAERTSNAKFGLDAKTSKLIKETVKINNEIQTIKNKILEFSSEIGLLEADYLCLTDNSKARRTKMIKNIKEKKIKLASYEDKYVKLNNKLSKIKNS